VPCSSMPLHTQPQSLFRPLKEIWQGFFYFQGFFLRQSIFISISTRPYIVPCSPVPLHTHTHTHTRARAHTHTQHTGSLGLSKNPIFICLVLRFCRSRFIFISIHPYIVPCTSVPLHTQPHRLSKISR